MSRGLRPTGTEFTTFDEGLLLQPDTHGYNFIGPGVVATLHPGDPLVVDITIAGGAGGTLQNAYDNGETITTDAQGAIDFIRGALTPDGESILTIVDADANPGRTVPLVSISDSNTVGAGTTDTVQVSRAVGGQVARLISTDPGVLGVVFTTFHDSASPGAGDVVGRWDAHGRNNGGAEVSYGSIDFQASGVGAGNISGDIMFRTVDNNALRNTLNLLSYGGGHALLVNPGAAGDPAFRFRSTHNYGAESAFSFEDNNGASTLMSVEGDGDCEVLQDIEAAGGYQKSLGLWTHALIANQTDVRMTLAGSVADDWVAFRPGSLTGIATRTDAAVGAGTLTINARINGAIIFTSAITGTTTVTTQAKDVDAFVAGDLFTASYTTSAAFAGPVIASVEFEIEE